MFSTWRIRPYQHDSTASRPLSEVKHVRAWLVLRWGTTLESQVLYSFLLQIFALSPLRHFLFPLRPSALIVAHTFALASTPHQLIHRLDSHLIPLLRYLQYHSLLSYSIPTLPGRQKHAAIQHLWMIEMIELIELIELIEMIEMIERWGMKTSVPHTTHRFSSPKIANLSDNLTKTQTHEPQQQHSTNQCLGYPSIRSAQTSNSHYRFLPTIITARLLCWFIADTLEKHRIIEKD